MSGKNTAIPVKGGFPRIKVTVQKLDTKQEQGFASIYSLKNLKSTKKNVPLIINDDTEEINIVNQERSVNGVDIDMFAF